MAEVYFFDSMGMNEPIESVEWLKHRVFKGNDLFWEGATGTCGLSFRVNSISKAFITLIGRENKGFMIDHLKSNEEQTKSLRYGEHTGETIEAETGGNPDLYFKEYFVPKEMAWQAIEYFLKTGERDPSLIWEIAEIVEDN